MFWFVLRVKRCRRNQSGQKPVASQLMSDASADKPANLILLGVLFYAEFAALWIFAFQIVRSL